MSDGLAFYPQAFVIHRKRSRHVPRQPNQRDEGLYSFLRDLAQIYDSRKTTTALPIADNINFPNLSIFPSVRSSPIHDILTGRRARYLVRHRDEKTQAKSHCRSAHKRKKSPLRIKKGKVGNIEFATVQGPVHLGENVGTFQVTVGRSVQDDATDLGHKKQNPEDLWAQLVSKRSRAFNLNPSHAFNLNPLHAFNRNPSQAFDVHPLQALQSFQVPRNYNNKKIVRIIRRNNSRLSPENKGNRILDALSQRARLAVPSAERAAPQPQQSRANLLLQLLAQEAENEESTPSSIRDILSSNGPAEAENTASNSDDDTLKLVNQITERLEQIRNQTVDNLDRTAFSDRPSVAAKHRKRSPTLSPAQTIYRMIDHQQQKGSVSKNNSHTLTQQHSRKQNSRYISAADKNGIFLLNGVLHGNKEKLADYSTSNIPILVANQSQPSPGLPVGSFNAAAFPHGQSNGYSGLAQGQGNGANQSVQQKASKKEKNATQTPTSDSEQAPADTTQSPMQAISDFVQKLFQ